MFWLCGFGVLLSVWFGRCALANGIDAKPFGVLALVFLVGVGVSMRGRW